MVDVRSAAGRVCEQAALVDRVVCGPPRGLRGRRSFRPARAGRRLFWVAAFAGLGGSLVSCSADEQVQVPVSPAVSGGAVCREERSGPWEFQYSTVESADPARLRLDVYLPASCAPVPALVWFHGGGWVEGDKRGPGVEEKVRLAESAGMALVAVNYRLAGPQGFRWPAQGTDGASALVWLRAAGPQLGLDMDRLIVGGFSAGGHIAVMLASDPTRLAAAGLGRDAIDCVVALDSGALDLREPPKEWAGLLEVVFGPEPEDVEKGSPVFQVETYGRPGGRVLVVASRASERFARQESYVETVVANDGWARLVDAGDHAHEQMNLLLGAVGESTVSQPVSEFLSDCVRGVPVSPAPDGSFLPSL